MKTTRCGVMTAALGAVVLGALGRDQLGAEPPPVPATPAAVPAIPDAARPAPRPDEWWAKKHAAQLADIEKGGHEIVFLGDSITEGWLNEGKPAWERDWLPRHAVNLGIGGDRTQHLLYRLDHGAVRALTAKRPDGAPVNPVTLVVLMIGTNNSNGTDNTAEEIGAGIKAIAERLRAGLPEAKVLLLAIFPRGEKPDAQREKNARASAIAASAADTKAVRFVDLSAKFTDAEGTISREIMPDFLHLSPKGYEIWSGELRRLVDEMLPPAPPPTKRK